MAQDTFWGAAFSSVDGAWETPIQIVAHLSRVFDWDLDVCAHRGNVCQNYYTEEEDGLTRPWEGLCWMNPPYGDEIAAWIHKAAMEPATVVALVPARTDTAWWQDNVAYASLVVFIRGRLKFGGAKNSAPFPSAFMVFGEIADYQAKTLQEYGWAVQQEAIELSPIESQLKLV